MEDNKSVAQRMIEVQSLLKAPKGQYNSFGKYKYRSCEDILEAVKPLLAERGLLLYLKDTIERVGDVGGDDSLRWYVRATATVTDGTGSVSTTAYAREDATKKGMDGSQVTGASSSYARKYALNALFLIDDTKDADATNTHGATEKPQKPRKQPYKASTPPQVTATDSDAHSDPQATITPEELSDLRQSFVNYRNALGMTNEDALAKLLAETGIAEFGSKMTKSEFDRAHLAMGKAIAASAGARVVE